jgi:hypothetical protein
MAKICQTATVLYEVLQVVVQKETDLLGGKIDAEVWFV